VQKASNAQFGLAKGDGVTIDCGTVAGTCASAAGVTNATTSTAGTGASPTIAQFDAGWYKNLLAGSLTATIPVSTSLSIYGGVFVAGINAGTIAATSPDTITSAAGTTGPGGNIAVDAGCNATVTTNGAGNLYVAGNLCNATGAAFSALTSGTNTIAAMVLGTGASMSFAGATLPTPGAGVLGIAGEATKPTLAANGEGAVWLDSTTGGLGLIGKGSGSDVSMYNSAGTLGCAIATGTTTLSCVGLQGGTLTATGVTTVATVEGAERTVTAGSTDTLLSTDCGKTVLYNNAAYTVTIPAAIVPPAGTSCQIDIVTDTANKVTVTGTAVSAATLVSADSYTGTRNLAGAGISLKLINDGAAKAYLFGFGS
jgi:hypothetical protein